MKPPLFYLVSLASCILGLGASFAQSNHNEYQKGESIVSENFDSANPKWELNGFQISSGWMSKSGGKGLAMLPVAVDQKRDFEMEVLIQFNAPVNLFQEVIFGEYIIRFSLSYSNVFT